MLSGVLGERLVAPLATAMNDFAPALRDLDEAGVRYAVVGGLAVIRHGAVRATKELDAAVPPAAENLVRLREADGELPGDV